MIVVWVTFATAQRWPSRLYDEERLKVNCDAGQGVQRDRAARERDLVVGAIRSIAPGRKRRHERMQTPNLAVVTGQIHRTLLVDIVGAGRRRPNLDDEGSRVPLEVKQPVLSRETRQILRR